MAFLHGSYYATDRRAVGRSLIELFHFQKFEYSHVHDAVPVRAHVVATARYERAFEIANEPMRSRERPRGIRYDFLVADEQ